MKTAQMTRVCGGVDWSKLPRIEIDAPISESDSPATAYAQICATEEALCLHLSATEPEVRAVETSPLAEVCEDSCLEFFFRPMEGSMRYFNMEWNPNKCLFLGFGSSIEDLLRIVPEEAQKEALFCPEVIRREDGWEIFFRVPYSFIRGFFPEFEVKPGKALYCNFYKCGEMLRQPHYLTWNPIMRQGRSRFHTPAEFGRLDVV